MRCNLSDTITFLVKVRFYSWHFLLLWDKLHEISEPWFTGNQHEDKLKFMFWRTGVQLTMLIPRLFLRAGVAWPTFGGSSENLLQSKKMIVIQKSSSFIIYRHVKDTESFNCKQLRLGFTICFVSQVFWWKDYVTGFSQYFWTDSFT